MTTTRTKPTVNRQTITCVACKRPESKRLLGGQNRYGELCRRCRDSVRTYRSFQQLHTDCAAGDVKARLLILAAASNLGCEPRQGFGEGLEIAWRTAYNAVINHGTLEVPEGDLLAEVNFVRECL